MTSPGQISTAGVSGLWVISAITMLLGRWAVSTRTFKGAGAGASERTARPMKGLGVSGELLNGGVALPDLGSTLVARPLSWSAKVARAGASRPLNWRARASASPTTSLATSPR